MAYRRQATAELTYQFTVRAHAVAIDAQRTATRQYELDSQKYELDRQRHNLETERRHDDRERELRARFGSIAAQLGAERFAERLASVFALASLADDWHRAGNDVERQTCVDLFCAQLRRPRVPRRPPGGAGGMVFEREWSPQLRSEDTEIRTAMVSLLRSHRPLIAEGDDTWNSCSLDLSGTDLSGFNLNQTNLQRVNFDDADLSETNMRESDLSDATMARAILSAAYFEKANMLRAKLFSARSVDSTDEEQPWANAAQFNSADLRGAWFTNARLPYSEFDGADLTAARLDDADLRNCQFIAATLSSARLRGSNLTNANLGRADLHDTMFNNSDLTGARFSRSRYNEGTQWPDDKPPEGIGPPEPEPEVADTDVGPVE